MQDGQAVRAREGISSRYLRHVVDQGVATRVHPRSWSLVKMGTTANQKQLFFHNLRKARAGSPPDEGVCTRQVKRSPKSLGVTDQT